MATERSNHERGKSDLNKELENVLKAATALASNFTSQEVLPSEITQNLCNVVEAVFIHGLRDPFFLKGSRYAKYPEPNFWPFVSKYSHRNITNQINALNQIKSEIGKGRAWIRIVLNEFSLEHYLQLLLQERKAMSQFYNDWAFLRDSEQVDRMLGFVKTLSGIPVNAAINTGLVTGKPIKVGALQIHRKPSVPSIEPVETGVSALEYLPSTLNVLSPIRGNQRNVIMTVVSDDDASSIYSHPSMLDRHERTNILQAASSPKDPLFINQQQASLCISRRTKRPRRSSRSSSESNSQGTRKSEGTSRSRLDSEIPSSVPNDVFVETVSEQAVPTASVSSAEETSSEKNENEAGASSNTSEDVPIETSPSTARVIREVRETEELEDEEREQEKEKHSKDNGESEPTVVCDSCSPKKEIVQEVEQEVLAKDEELPNEPEVFPSKDYEVTKSMGIDIYPGRHHDDSMLGTSLHDELSAISSPPVGNALSSSGAWTVPRKSCDFGDGDTSGILSSSSGSSGAPVSFGQALRSAMEQHSPTEEEESFNEETEEEVERKKSSMQMGITQRLTTIARETGLVAQDFRCPMCRKSIGPYFNFAKYEMCGVDGLYYCMDCTKPGGTYSIPARVLHSWDWEIRTVSDRGRAFIEANLERPIINIEEMNPKLYDHVPALKTVLKLRERLQAVSLYLFNCRESIADDFRKRIQPRDYLYNKIHLYSFMDLQNVRSGNLEKQIQGWLKYAIGHVMGCVLCRQKGFVCEICDKTDVIYPFNTQTTHRCPDCFSVYHLDCAVGNPCPKCARRAEYQVKEKADMLFLD